ncbi:MAG TPA: hypothetical protein VG898_08830 [Solirubrobacterales bacterium]|nr:hypothetical protein [Solirubrobacterales bacterium]
MQGELAERELGQVVKGGGDPSVFLVWFNLASELDYYSTLRILDHHIESQETVKGVLDSVLGGRRVVLLGEVERAGEMFLEQRGFDINGADLRPIGATSSRSGVERLISVINRSADAQALGGRGIDRHSSWQCDNSSLDMRLGVAVSVEQTGFWYVQLKVET